MAPGHFDRVEIYTDHAITAATEPRRPALILIAVLAGGDYDVSITHCCLMSPVRLTMHVKEGLRGCGMTITHGLSKYRLGEALVDAFTTKDRATFTRFLSDWQDDLHNILATDPAGLLGRRYVTLANNLADFIPSYEIMQRYVNPLNTFTVTGGPAANSGHHNIESRQPDLGVLARLCEQRFQWTSDVVATKLRSVVWEGALLRQLCRVSGDAILPTWPRNDNEHLH